MILDITKDMADAYDRQAARRVESERARKAAARAHHRRFLADPLVRAAIQGVK
jgi:conjugal transfer/entry exclusion protein